MSGTEGLDEPTLRAIVEEASDGIFISDSDFRITWVNRAACEVLGLPLQELVGKRISDLLWCPEDLVKHPLRRDDLLAGRTTITTRTFRTASGEQRTLEVSARLIAAGRLLGIARDATERLAAEERLRRSEASFRALIEGSPLAILVHRNGRIVYANSECARMLGWSTREEGIGGSVVGLVHHEDRPEIIARIGSLEAGASMVPFTEERIRRADGSHFAASVSAIRIVFEGEPSIVVLATDITERRRVEEQLARADRLASVGTLAAGVAHEINNPLTYVLLHLDAIAALASARSDGERIVEHAHQASEGAQRVARIVRDLGVFSRAQPDVREPIDVRRPIDIAINTASHELKHRARVVRELGEVPRVLASEGRIAQIVLNLLLNAAQAIPEGHPDDNEVRVRTFVHAGEVHISISDTGAGIAEEHRKRLFEPFFTTKQVGEGTGLGLAICHGLVTALGGRIEVESVAGKGSTFTVILAAAALLHPPPSAPQRASRPAGRARILFIDDEPAIVAAVTRALGSRHDLVTLTSGLAARSLLERDDDFDAVVCDVMMPELTGADLHQWMRDRRPHLVRRTMFISGGRMGGATRMLGDIEAHQWLEKPFAVDALEIAIGELVRRANKA